MTLYLLFVTIGAVTYLGTAAAVAYGTSGTHIAFAIGFTVVVTVWVFDAAAIVLSVSRYAYTWVLLVTFGLCAAIAIAIEGTRHTSADVSATSIHKVAGPQLTRARLDGQRLFNDLGCVDCHATGIGPDLTNRFGSPVADGCGALTIDEAYIRESILNPTAVVATGFSPIMPSFSSKVSESELSALVAYVASLSTPVGSH